MSTETNEIRITLAMLDELGACGMACQKFARVFGEEGAPTAKEVFVALAREKQWQWLFWLATNLNTFACAVGNFSKGDFYCVVEGKIELSCGFAIASGSATIEAYGSATVRASGSATVRASDSATIEAYGSATVRASGSATVRAYGSATVEAYDSATIEAYGSATVRASDSATVRASDSATVRASDSATVRASDSATIEAYGSATVRASGSATVRAYGSATVLLNEYSLMVKFSINSEFSCVIDRRYGKPQLILVSEVSE